MTKFVAKAALLVLKFASWYLLWTRGFGATIASWWWLIAIFCFDLLLLVTYIAVENEK